MNCLVSTTRMWNPGDEVIYLGVKHLLEARFGRITPVLWNRNPGVKPMRGGYDNSFDGRRHSLEVFDYFVSAGGPEWLGPRVSDIYSCLLSTELRCLHLGIGLGKADLTWDTDSRRIFEERSDLVTCRDRTTFEALQGVVPQDSLHLLPCPSLFAFLDDPKPRTSRKVRKVGLNFQGAGMRFNNVRSETLRRCLAAFTELAKAFEVTVICNYVNDFDEAVRIFDPSIVRFSADIRDYPAFFDEVDVVVGTRIHGCMGGISSGTPGFLLDSDQDLRRKGVREVVEVLDEAPIDGPALVEILGGIDPAELSERNRSYAGKVKGEYLELLGKIPDPVGKRPRPAEGAPTKPARGPLLGERLSSACERAEALLEKVGRRVG